MKNKNIDQDKAASLIRGVLGIQRRNQSELSRKLGISRLVLNLFLNRKVDLPPQEIERILEELNVKDKVLPKLSTPAGIQS